MTDLRNKTSGSPERTVALTDLNVVEQLDMECQQNISGGSSAGRWFKKHGVGLGIEGGETAGVAGVLITVGVLSAV